MIVTFTTDGCLSLYACQRQSAPIYVNHISSSQFKGFLSLNFNLVYPEDLKYISCTTITIKPYEFKLHENRSTSDPCQAELRPTASVGRTDHAIAQVVCMQVFPPFKSV